ncbi:hypothetical protein TSAR_011501, partial [Trichomalopsis sarcophagae]
MNIKNSKRILLEFSKISFFSLGYLLLVLKLKLKCCFPGGPKQYEGLTEKAVAQICAWMPQPTLHSTVSLPCTTVGLPLIVFLLKVNTLGSLGNAGVCRQIAQGSFLKDAEWATHSCIISFETIGIWHDGFDKIEINSCSRSEDGRLLAVGDSLGKVKLFSYPACQPKSLFHNYNGHFNNVTNIAFLHDDTRLISNGGTDTSILQWI